ncbi:hypothetical protein [Sphingomonas oligophenolica]|uniref:Uncharacterized protein n=1 Tax=Sphingomonas oligophenolica TaxID=301154 RepID=A0A502C755_9SPHN|nr:hypothetical protein [Sphingomonas oligophenolica]TPG08474.1 hypothetical protein EAH84_13970 [Sphingomonas oligophenolica]
MSRLTLPFASPILLLVLISGCARHDRGYPSLLPRPVEALGFAEPETEQPDVSPDPALDAKIAEQRQSLARVAKGFTDAAATAEAAAGRAKGRAVGTDAWLDAQSRLAELDDWRAQASALVTDIDQMIADRAAALAPIYPPLATLRDQAVAEATRQGQAITRIEAMVPPA